MKIVRVVSETQVIYLYKNCLSKDLKVLKVDEVSEHRFHIIVAL